jgi:hypothetical protein
MASRKYIPEFIILQLFFAVSQLVKVAGVSPNNAMSDPGPREGYSTMSNSRHFMAVSLLKIHQMFMLAFAWLRVEGEVAQVLVVSQPPPLAFLVDLSQLFLIHSYQQKNGETPEALKVDPSITILLKD